MTQPLLNPSDLIAGELNIQPTQVNAAIELLDGGATVPFIARYRKEVTKGLDDQQLRQLSERLIYLRELDARKQAILQSLTELGKLTPELQVSIIQADNKTRLEDIYLPYRPKRRTKAQLAREAGLEPLAVSLLNDPTQSPDALAPTYVDADKGIADVAAAIEGAQQILMEDFAENADLVATLREMVWQKAKLKATKHKNHAEAKSKFKDYFDFSQAIKSIPSHRALALFRGRRESALQVSMVLDDEQPMLDCIYQTFNLAEKGRPADQWLLSTAQLAWKIKLLTKIELELLNRLREAADDAAITVFSKNLNDLLLAAPAGQHITLGLDPGIRTGVKAAVVDATGKLLDYTTVYPLAPQNDWHGAITDLAKLMAKYHVSLVSIGNGTASRETERLVTELAKIYADIPFKKMVVSEAGASVYSASQLASEEFPDIDVSIRGAISIARRLQDPLAELVKIDPKSIGVGQYQHDVNQAKLARTLTAVVEDCVNAVGVDLNTASVALLTYVSGLNEGLAKQIVAYRDEHGRFNNRQQLLNVPRLGEKSYEQCAAFLRIQGGDNPLDTSAVHPEAYPLVEKMIQKSGLSLAELIGNMDAIRSLKAQDFVDDHYGLPTVQDVIKELEKPGRDPRPEFKTVQFKEGVEAIKDLHLDMELEGVVSNVTNFGAFVDIGVHQDGLVHISEMNNQFIKDPHQVVKAGDIIKVRVIEVDVDRSRISLSMRPKGSAPVAKKVETTAVVKKASHKANKTKPLAKPDKTKKVEKKSDAKVFNTAMADALSKFKRNL
ncbi:Tex family protein [Legionella sp. W05-934-2]|jgi:uncharacterized protein|uniref:Tex family protein n=1 Tax=Legionella sp. W05-934-2 TaxID=1198649 RepID=UPI0034634DA8